MAGQGVCSDSGVCVCNPGYFGGQCETPYPCNLNCTSLHRDKCVANDFCGPCVSRYATKNLQFGADTFCELFSPTPIMVNSSVSLYGTDPDETVDDDVLTSWATNFMPLTNLSGTDQTGNIDDSNPYQFPFLQLTFNEQIAVTRYDVVSSNADPSMDPKDWKLQGSNDGVDWAELDAQTGVLFEARSDRMSFLLKPFSKFSIVRLLVTDIRDAQFQGAVTINATTVTEDGANETTSSTNVTTSAGYVPVLRIGELSVYRDSTPVAGLAEPLLTDYSHYAELSTEQVRVFS